MRRLKLIIKLLTFFIINFATLIDADEVAQPNVQPQLEKRQVLIGESLSLSCPTLKERPEWWQMNTYAIAEANVDGTVIGRPNVAIEGKNLLISNVTFADEGNYFCYDTVSPLATFTVNVNAFPLPPAVWALPPDKASVADQKQTVVCESRYGRPVASLTWQVGGQGVEPKSAEIRQEANGTFTMSSSIEVVVANIVDVSCSAKHQDALIGTESIKLRPYLLSEPTITPKVLDRLRAGQMLVVECRIPNVDQSQSRPSLIWSLPNGTERQQVFIEGGFIVNRMAFIVAREMNGKSLSCRSELSYTRSVPVELKMVVEYAPTKPNLAVILPSGKTQLGIDDLLKVKVNCDGVDAFPKAQARILINGMEVNTSMLIQPPLANSLLSLIPNNAMTSQIVESVRSAGTRTTVACIAWNAVGSGASDIVSLPVFSIPNSIRLGLPTGEFPHDLDRGIYTFRSGATAMFLCDMSGGELSKEAKAMWTFKCPEETNSNGEIMTTMSPGTSPEMLARMYRLVEKFNEITPLEIDAGDPKHARASYSQVIGKIHDECQVTCRAIDPVAGNSTTNTQLFTLQVFYGPEEVNVRFGQSAPYNDGETVNATCEIAASKPKPQVVWSILTANGQETTTSIPAGQQALTCSPGLVSTCNATIEFVAKADITGSIVRCTATNPKISHVVSNDRRLHVLFKPRSTNPSRCFSRFVVEFDRNYNLTEHCAFESNPSILAQHTQIWLVSTTNSAIRQHLTPQKGYPAQAPGQRPAWEIIRINRRPNKIDEDLNFLDSFLLVTLQNAVGFSEFNIPVRINQNVIDVDYVNPLNSQREFWIGDSVEVTCTISSLYKVSRFAFDQRWIRQGDVDQSISGDLRTIKLNIPKVQQEVDLPGEVRRVGCVAEFPPGTPVKKVNVTRDIAIFGPIKGAVIKENKTHVQCQPTVGNGGELRYRWWENNVELMNIGNLNVLPAKNRTKYQCEITQKRGDEHLSTKMSDIYVVGQTSLIFFELNVTALRAFSSVAEFFVEKRLTDEMVLAPTTVLPPAELRVSIQRNGNEQEYRTTVLINGDWQLFNITDLLPGSTYNFTFWKKTLPPKEDGQVQLLTPEYWKMFSTVVITTAGAPLAVLRLRPEETAIVIILSAVSAALFLLLCNIFICIKIRRKRQLMESARHQSAGRRPSSCCFISEGMATKQDHETTANSDTSPPASEAESGPTSVDMLTPNGASCSSSTSNGSANALFVSNGENTSTLKTDRKSIGSSSRRKSADLVEVVQGLFRPDGLLLKPKYAQPNVSDNQPLSNSIYRELFGNDATLSPILPNLDFLDAPNSQIAQQSGLLDNSALYRSQSSAVYNIPMPFQFQHIGGDVVPGTATAMAPAMPRTETTSRTASSEVPLELQGDLV